jgi:uncharacterized protein YbgA (DUF1722 family)/uncharacterized protein YbbK (DUF523 family)
MTRAPIDERPRIGISACLLGARVRFDGGHKRDDFITDELARFVDFVPVCPEMDLGLGAPRESLRLVGSAERARLVAPRSGNDYTDAMRAYAQRRAEAIAGWSLDGFIFKKDSPSCGVWRVRVYGPSGVPTRDGRGLFAAALMRHDPLLPVEEEGRLRDLRLRENFLVRIFMHPRLRRLFHPRWRHAELVRFHTSAKLLLLAHSTEVYRRLGRTVATAAARPRGAVQEEYRRGVLEALAVVPSRGKHVNALEHLAGFLRNRSSADERAELRETIDAYRRGEVPLAVPLTLVRHHVRRHRIEYLEAQLYLVPFPRALRPDLAL